MGMPKNTGRTWFKKGNVPHNKGKKLSPEHLSSIIEANQRIGAEKRARNPRPWHDKDWLIENYVNQKKTPRELSEMCGTGDNYKCFLRELHRHGIIIRGRSEAGKISYATGRQPIRTGDKHPNWRGGSCVIGAGTHKYRLIYIGPNKHEFEHILVAQKALGRELKDGEVVHHINGDGLDNKNDNLLICDKNYHSWLHQRMSRLYMEENFGR